MSVSVRLTTAAASAVLVAAALLTAPAQAATAPPGPAEQSAPPAGPGKGDSDHDGIADDLEAALASSHPGDRLGVIVQGGSPAAARRAAPSFAVDRVYRTIPAFAGSLTAGQVRALAAVPGVTRVELNGTTQIFDASGDHDYGVDAARATGASPDGTLDGSGVGICVIDTGVDPGHEQLQGKVVGWHDWVNGRTDPYDDNGHGTHVSSIAAGSGVGHPEWGGVARGADIIAAKVIASSGSGADADVVSAIEWCAARDDVDVISMSLGSPGSDGSDAGSLAADAAVAAGKVVVAAAGNGGDAPGTIASPGVATDVVTVGAASDPSALAGPQDTDSGLYLAGFSSRGPTSNPDAPVKPDVVAPGISVVAAQAGTTNGYIAYSGTSMATPFVAGVAALGLESDPSASPAQVKAALRASARDAGTAGPDPEWGAGLVDARSFLAALGTAGDGTAPWPAHTLLQGSLGAGSTIDLPVTVTTSGEPLSVTMRTVGGSASCLLWIGDSCIWGYEWAPDLDLYLIDPSGVEQAMSRCMLEATNGNCAAPGRFETIGIPSAQAGTWTVRVESFSGAGNFAADVFGAIGQGTPPPSPPSAPTALAAAATSATTIEVTWTDTAAGEDGFTLQRCAGAGCSGFADLATLDPDVEAYTDTGLTAATSYTYRVRAEGPGGSSAWSDPASATTDSVATPVAPTDLRTTSVTTSEVDLAWSDGSGTASGYRVLRCEGNRCSPVTVLGEVGADAREYRDTAVSAKSRYTYVVEAWNAAGVARSAELTVRTPRR